MTVPIGLMIFKGEIKSDYSVMFAGIVIAPIRDDTRLPAHAEEGADLPPAR